MSVAARGPVSGFKYFLFTGCRARTGPVLWGAGVGLGDFFQKLFAFEKISDFGTVALSFVCDKYYPIIDQLGSKYSSRDFQLNCVISFCFHLYLMLHACAVRFDVTGMLKTF